MLAMLPHRCQDPSLDEPTSHPTREHGPEAAASNLDGVGYVRYATRVVLFLGGVLTGMQLDMTPSTFPSRKRALKFFLAAPWTCQSGTRFAP